MCGTIPGMVKPSIGELPTTDTVRYTGNIYGLTTFKSVYMS